MPYYDVETRQKMTIRNSDRRSWIQNHNLSSILEVKLKTLHRNKENTGSKLQRQISDLKQEVRDRKEEQKVCNANSRRQSSDSNMVKQVNLLYNLNQKIHMILQNNSYTRNVNLFGRV